MNVHPLTRRRALVASGYRCEHLYSDGKRCPNKSRLNVHHRVYSVPGMELPSHIEVRCVRHHGLKHGIDSSPETT